MQTTHITLDVTGLVYDQLLPIVADEPPRRAVVGLLAAALLRVRPDTSAETVERFVVGAAELLAGVLQEDTP